jgi:hypothetical protein
MRPLAERAEGDGAKMARARRGAARPHSFPINVPKPRFGYASNEDPMKLTERLSATDLAELDTLIVERRVLPLLKFIRSRLGVSISETQDVWLERYRELRIERPDDFTVADDAYWMGLYS